MEKIIILYDSPERTNVLMTVIAEIFPECEIIAVQRDIKSFFVDGGQSPLRECSQITGVKADE